jgi:hypothetical protein
MIKALVTKFSTLIYPSDGGVIYERALPIVITFIMIPSFCFFAELSVYNVPLQRSLFLSIIFKIEQSL